MRLFSFTSNRSNVILHGRIIGLMLLLLGGHVFAQNSTVFNIDSRNGLTTDHIYFTQMDRLGYLWIGTSDGLYRYNGYNLKRYGYGEGLASVDVWKMTEDSKGRLWPYSIAPDIGYIKNNRYEKVVMNERDDSKVVYPAEITELGDSIVFVNRTHSNHSALDIGIVHNDTLIWASFNNESVLEKTDIVGDKIHICISSHQVMIKDVREHLKQSDKGEIREVEPGIIRSLAWSFVKVNFKDYIFFFDVGESHVGFYNIKTGKLTTVNLPDSTSGLIYAIPSLDTCYAFAGDNIYAIDRSISIRSSYNIHRMFPGLSINPATNTCFVNDSYWGKCLSTSDRGVFIRANNENLIRETHIDLNGYKHLSTVDDVGYWWSEKEHTLKKVKDGRVIESESIKNVAKIRKVIKVNEDVRFILISAMTLVQYSGKLVTAAQFFVHSALNGKPLNVIDEEWLRIRYMVDCIPIDANSFYEVAGGSLGLNKVVFNVADSFTEITNIDRVRYESGCYNKKLGVAVFYNRNKLLFVYDNNLEQISVNNDMLELYGVKGVEKVALDDYGNVFIKDYNSLKVFNINNNSFRPLFENLVLEKTKFDLTDNVLTMAGLFGVVRCRVSGPDHVTDVKNYPNVKGLYYSSITDVQFSKSGVLLKTEKGMYWVGTDTVITPGLDSSSIYLMYNKDSLFRFGSNDTIVVAPKTNTLTLDQIRPLGSGRWGSYYQYNGKMYANTNNKILVRDLMIGKYHDVTVNFFDNSWVSKPVHIIIYMQPEWWQTTKAKLIMLFVAVLLLIGMAYVIIVITRRIVNRNNEKKNYQSSLELKSIQSQINPHFIFNTLSTSLYHINRNENEQAFNHISQFAELLQAYIRSSRNKYITIAEEIENIENYLELQLARFEDKFGYSISIDKAIDPTLVKIPSLILQPIVENALNHGIFHKDGHGLVIISFEIDSEDSSVLVIKVDDDGVGRQRSKMLRSSLIKKADSYGSVLIKELVDVFNKYEKIHIEIEYIDKKQPEMGTTVIIKIRNFEYAE